MERKEITRAESRQSWLLWYGILGPPLIWGGQLVLNYGLESDVVCAPGSGPGTDFFNVGIETVIQTTNSVATALTVLGLAVSIGCYRRLRGRDRTVAQRATWMSVAGMFSSGIFLIVIALKFASPIFLEPCTGPL